VFGTVHVATGEALKCMMQFTLLVSPTCINSEAPLLPTANLILD